MAKKLQYDNMKVARFVIFRESLQTTLLQFSIVYVTHVFVLVETCLHYPQCNLTSNGSVGYANVALSN